LAENLSEVLMLPMDVTAPVFGIYRHGGACCC